MKKILILLSFVLLLGCGGLGLNPKYPKHDLKFSGSFVRVEPDNYYLFRGNSSVINPGYVNEKDTLRLGDSLYHFVFFAKIVPDKLSKDYKNIPSHPGALHFLYVKGNFSRKKLPGFGSKEFAVVEDVVGVE